MNTGFLGRDGFIWFVGVIEDRQDPEKLGRVKVRALGYHTADKQKIKTADLPWAEVMQPTGDNAMGGIGDSPIGIIEGTWVVGFFRDPISLQEPIIMGTLPGRNTKPAQALKALGKHRGEMAEGGECEFGFYDPTNELTTIPYDPDSETYSPGDTSTSGTITDISEDKDIKVPSYKEVAEATSLTKLKTKSATVGTHTQGLVDNFGTTRRLTIDSLYDSGTNYGELPEHHSATEMTGDPTLDAKAVVGSTGYLHSGDTQGTKGAWWPRTQEKESRVPYPRLDKVQKKDLTESQVKVIKQLFDEGVYGDKEWDKVKNSDYVILPKADTNLLAQGGYAISGISTSGLVSLTSYKVKPNLSVKDKIQISGVVGMENLNGQTFTLSGVSLGATSGSVTITMPASEKGTYVSGGVVLPNSHPVLSSKAKTREMNINAGGPDLEYPDSSGEIPKAAGTFHAYWNQPTSRYAARYPYNHVYESESGHIKEFDDTPGAERIHEYHRSGTFYEIDHQGMKVDYVKGDNYNIRVHDDYLYVKGNIIYTGDGEVVIRGNDTMSLSSKWRISIHSGGDVELYSKRNINFRADGDLNLQAGGHVNIQGDVCDAEDKRYAYQAGNRKKETVSQINLRAGAITLLTPDPKGATGGHIHQEAFKLSSHKVRDGKLDIEVVKDSADTGIMRILAGEKLQIQTNDGDLLLNSKSGNINLDASTAISQKAGDKVSISGGAGVDIVGIPINLNSGGGASSVTAISDVVKDMSISHPGKLRMGPTILDLKIPKDETTLTAINTTTRDNERDMDMMHPM